MEIDFTGKAIEHLKYFKKTNDQVILKKIRQLLEVILETPIPEWANLKPRNTTTVVFGAEG